MWTALIVLLHYPITPRIIATWASMFELLGAGVGKGCRGLERVREFREFNEFSELGYTP
jgi:hypothetical protein